MGLIKGALNSFDQDREFAGTIGQDVIYEAITEDLARYNEAMAAAMSIFVGGDTTGHKVRHKMPGYAQMQKLGKQAPPHNVKVQGYYDVAFPLYGLGLGYAWNDVDIAYLSIGDIKRALNTVKQAYADAMRHAILSRIFDNTQSTFSDDVYGDLDVEPLANDDGTEYPPIVGGTAAHEDDHYLVSGYTTANISDANDPSETLRDELLEHSGYRQGGNDILFLADETVCGYMEALTDFVSVADYAVRPGEDQDSLIGIPATPGRVIGRIHSCWVVEWRWMPANYIIARNLDMPAPLVRRIDEAGTGLAPGLQAVATVENSPLEGLWFRARQGFGTLERVSASVMELTADASYDIPSGYTVSY